MSATVAGRWRPWGLARVHVRAPWALGYLALVVFGLLARPVLPVDETRYLGVAWEMWQRGDWLVPHLNGEPYGHKPPLLFWLIHLGWWLGGVSEVWPRLLGPLVAVACCWRLGALAAALWPGQPRIAALVPWLYLGSAYALVQSTALNFDMLLLLGIVGAWHALVRAARGERTAWLIYALWLGFAMLAKGPVALVYVLPAWLIAPFWGARGRMRWYGAGMAALAVGSLVPLGWVALVAQQQSMEFVHHLLLDQSLQRVSGDIGHPRPPWWYLPLLPAMALPWIAWPAAWPPAWRRAWRRPGLPVEPGLRFALGTALAALLVLSAMASKQAHYLLPVLALLSLAGARWLQARVPIAAVHRVATGCWLLVALALFLFAMGWRPAYDLRDFGRRVGEAQRQGQPVALVANKYQGEFGYFGRLERPIVLLRATEATEWIRRHPNGLVLVREKRVAFCSRPTIAFAQPYKSDRLFAIPARSARDACFNDNTGRSPGCRCGDGDTASVD